MATGSQAAQHRHPERQPRWDRLDRADRCAPSWAWRTHGISERQAATERTGPRTPRHAWRLWHGPRESCPAGAQVLPSGPGRACVHRLGRVCPLGCVAVGACGMRVAWLWLTRSGLDRFGAAASGAQPPGTRPMAEALGASRHTAPARWATGMPRRDLPVPPDAPLPGGRCLGTMAPASPGMIVAPLAQGRAHPSWKARRAPALAPRNGQGMPAPRDAAPGLLASVAQALAAHHAPAVCPGQPALRQAVSAPRATTARAARPAGAAARAPRAPVPTDCHTTEDAPPKRGPGRPPQAPGSLAQAQHACAAARRAHERLAQPRAPGHHAPAWPGSRGPLWRS